MVNTANTDEQIIKVEEKLKEAWLAFLLNSVDAKGLSVFIVPEITKPFTLSRQEVLDIIHELSRGFPIGGFDFNTDAGHISILHNLKLVLAVYECAVEAAAANELVNSR